MVMALKIMDNLRPPQTDATLRLLQWNVLADGLAQFGDFHRVHKSLLEWRARAPVLLREVLQANADVICMQELNHYDDWLLPELQQHGYSGVFWSKPFSPALVPGVRAEQKAFQYEDVEGILQNQGGIVCCFKDLRVKEEIVVATTHLKAKEGPVNEQMRVLQAQQLLQRLKNMTSNSSMPIVICGDFNSDPKSEVYKILQHHLRSVFALTCICDPPHAVEKSTVSRFCDTVCDGGAPAEPPFTTWKFRSIGEKKVTIDYIWYRVQSKLWPTKRWNLPSQASIGPDALPSVVIPSDHLPLLCEFIWRDLQVREVDKASFCESVASRIIA